MIRVATAALIALTASAGWTARNETPVLTVPARNYPSGFLYDAVPYLDATIQRGEQPVITGTVYSVGTLITRNPRTCAMKGACLGFHAPLHPSTGQPWLGSPRHIWYYLDHHPPALQAWIIRSGALTDLSGRYRYLCTPQLWKYVRPYRANRA